VPKKPVAEIGSACPFGYPGIPNSRRNGSQAATESRKYHIGRDPVGKEEHDGNLAWREELEGQLFGTEIGDDDYGMLRIEHIPPLQQQMMHRNRHSSETAGNLVGIPEKGHYDMQCIEHIE
jgi:hypothetical protein